jgi:cytochrome c peroxidase
MDLHRLILRAELVAKPFMVASLVFSLCSPAFGASTGAPDKIHAWSKEETGVLRSLWIGSLPPPPGDPTNKYSENPKAQRLGEKFFFDKRFSKNGKVSCGTCHQKGYSFTEEMPRAHGIGSTVRRTPHLIGMAYSSWFFWDGRADSLWAQALGPPENPNEHGITRTICAQIIAEHYRKEYEEVFGPLPQFPRDTCIPFAKPDPEDKEAYEAWTSMSPGKAEEINRVYANMGKAIAAYERLILPGPAKFDRYVEALLKGDMEKMRLNLDKVEVEGLRLFIGKAKCVNCHSGPLFTNGEFRRIGVYQPAELPPDTGRADGIRKVLANEFNCLGKYSLGNTAMPGRRIALS